MRVREFRPVRSLGAGVQIERKPTDRRLGVVNARSVPAASGKLILQTTVCCSQPFELHVDCSGTLSCVRDRMKSAAHGNARAYMWTRIWATWEDGLDAHKCLAHATMTDVAAERTTMWEKKGSDLADAFAKRGAAAHAIRLQHLAQLEKVEVRIRHP